MESVCSTIGIDRVDMSGKMILIEEQHGSEANFLVNAVISNALKNNYAICFVLFHNTFGHYHNVGMRNGYNLIALKEKGQISIVQPMKTIASNIDDLCSNILNINSSFLTESLDGVCTNDKDKHCTGISVAYKLFEHIKDSYNEIALKNESILLIIDDMSHLFDLGLSLRDSLYFIRYVRSFMQSQLKMQLCITVHTYQIEEQNCLSNLASNNLKYMAHLDIVTKPLMTGPSTDASGKILICWKVDSIRSQYHWPEKMIHLYKLSDWKVNLFAPGSLR